MMALVYIAQSIALGLVFTLVLSRIGGGYRK